MHRTPYLYIPGRIRASARVGVTCLAASLLLSACGMIAAFVPAIDVGDPLAIDERTVTATLQDGAIRTQATSHVDRTETMDLPDLEQDLHGFSLAAFRADIGLSDGIVLTGSPDAGSYPDTVTLTGARVEASLSDEANGSVAFDESFALDVDFRKQDCNDVSCRYLVEGSADLTGILGIELTDREQLETLVAILIRGEEETPNTGSIRLAVQLDSTPGVAGLTATFKLTSGGSTIRLGG